MADILKLNFPEMAQSDIKKFIDFFHSAAKKIRNEKAVFARGKDGKLVKNALKTFSERQLEMLALWFLAKKIKMKASIGAMLSKAATEELERKIKDPNFWKELDEIIEIKYKNNDITKK